MPKWDFKYSVSRPCKLLLCQVGDVGHVGLSVLVEGYIAKHPAVLVSFGSVFLVGGMCDRNTSALYRKRKAPGLLLFTSKYSMSYLSLCMWIITLLDFRYRY